MPELSAFAEAQQLMDEAFERLGLEENVSQLLRQPRRESHATLSVRLDDGVHRVFNAHRVQYNAACGPTLGGIRWHPSAHTDNSRAEAAWTTWQAAVYELPHGGASGAVDCNPKELSASEKERLARSYISAFREIVGPSRDVLLPATYISPQIMAWMTDAYEEVTGAAGTGVTAGKPTIIGGSPGQADATARGGCVAVREAATHLGLDVGNLSYAILGLGGVGRGVTTSHQELLGGGRLVAANDSRAGVINRDGIDPREIMIHKIQTGQVSDFRGTDPIDHEAILELDVDVLYVASVGGVINGDDAKRVKARIVCELADAACTAEADEVMRKQGTLVLPDILAGGGRLTVAHHETVQNSARRRWTLDEVYQRLESSTEAAWRAVSEMSEAEDCTLRLAAWMVGIERVAEACRVRGWC